MRTIEEINEQIIQEYEYINQLYAQIDAHEKSIKHLKEEKEWVKTSKRFKNKYYDFKPGTNVMIMDVRSDGYAIQNEDGHLITGCGFVL